MGEDAAIRLCQAQGQMVGAAHVGSLPAGVHGLSAKQPVSEEHHDEGCLASQNEQHSFGDVAQQVDALAQVRRNGGGLFLLNLFWQIQIAISSNVKLTSTLCDVKCDCFVWPHFVRVFICFSKLLKYSKFHCYFSCFQNC